MDTDHSDGALALRQALEARLARCPIDETWGALAEAEVLGMCVPEAHGGLGLSCAEAAPVFEVLGDLCRPTRFLESSIIAAALLGDLDGERAGALLCRLSDPQFVVAIAGIEPETARDLRLNDRALSGDATLVLDGGESDLILALVRLPERIVLVEARGEVMARYPTIDGRMAADLRFDESRCDILSADCFASLERALDIAVACTAIEAAASMRRLVEDTAEHVRQREQFGQAIGRFQAVQHRLVDMHIAARRAGAMAHRALAACADGSDRRAALVSAAKVTVAETGRFVGQNAVQLHGAMGMTDELPVGRYFKRLTVIEQQLGDRDTHLARFASEERAAS
ncbi:MULTISPECIES: acyl-CoA dehydrogenase family protein [Citromicrobium]|uniref:acyl-CoA dehydrogenase family protein n=1 Tax=Citromicrobium TaxID=72173 RepID=UPI0001DD057C|nr:MULTISPECIES: acyl-CoA dehydrogenase family protein [Citromicrobium]